MELGRSVFQNKQGLIDHTAVGRRNSTGCMTLDLYLNKQRIIFQHKWIIRWPSAYGVCWNVDGEVDYSTERSQSLLKDLPLLLENNHFIPLHVESNDQLCFWSVAVRSHWQFLSNWQTWKQNTVNTTPFFIMHFGAILSSKPGLRAIYNMDMNNEWNSRQNTLTESLGEGQS